MTNITILPPLNLEHPNLLVFGYAKQNDVKSRLYQAQMLAGDEAWEPPANATAAIRFRKGDRHGGWYDTLEDNSTPAVTWTGSTVTMAMAEQVLTCPGIVLIDLEFSGPDGSVLSFFRWHLDVEANAIDNAILTESSDYFNVLHQEMTAVLEAAANLTGLTAQATTLAPGSAATAEVTGGTDGNPYVLNLGIPRGNVGPAPTATNAAYAYALSDSGTTQPATFSGTRPTPTPGMYLWTRITVTWDNDTTTVFYTVSYQGRNGTGAVDTVCGVYPDANGNAAPTAADISATGGTVQSVLTALDTDLAAAEEDIAELQTAATPVSVTVRRYRQTLTVNRATAWLVGEMLYLSLAFTATDYISSSTEGDPILEMLIDTRGDITPVDTLLDLPLVNIAGLNNNDLLFRAGHYGIRCNGPIPSGAIMFANGVIRVQRNANPGGMEP